MTLLRSALALTILVAGFFGWYELVEQPQSGAFRPVLTHGAGHVVALTFDDGPTPGITDTLLSVLEGKHVAATFFVVGIAARRSPGLLRRMATDGDEVDDHSQTHAHLNAMLPATLDAEIGGADDAIVAATGRHASFLRPPFGARNAAVLDAARRRGLRVVLWNVTAGTLPGDSFTPDAASAWYAGDLAARVTDGAIVLLHDGDRGRGDGAELAGQARIVPRLIDDLRARGFRFVRVDGLAGAHA